MTADKMYDKYIILLLIIIVLPYNNYYTNTERALKWYLISICDIASDVPYNKEELNHAIYILS